MLLCILSCCRSRGIIGLEQDHVNFVAGAIKPTTDAFHFDVDKARNSDTIWADTADR